MSTPRDRERHDEQLSAARRRMQKHAQDTERSIIKPPEGMRMFKVKSAKPIKIDIIPFRAGKGNPYADEGELYFERTFHIHAGSPSGGRPVICLKETFGGKCPVCRFQAKLRQDEDADGDLIKKLYPKERQLWLVYDHNDPDAGVQLWDVSYHLFGKQLEAELGNSDPSEGFDHFYSIKRGCTLKVAFTEEKYNKNTFYKTSSVRFIPRDEPLDDKIVEQSICLDDLLKESNYDYDTVKAKFFEEAAADEGKKEESRGDEERPAKKRSQLEDDEPAPKRREEPEEEPAPKKRRVEEDEDRPRRREEPAEDEPAPKRRALVEDDEPAPKKRAADEDEDRPRRRESADDEPAPKKKRFEDDDWPEDDTPAKKKSAAAAEDDEPPRKKKSSLRDLED